MKERLKSVFFAKVARIHTAVIMMAMLLMMVTSSKAMASDQEYIENYVSARMNPASDTTDVASCSLDDIDMLSVDDTSSSYMAGLESILISGYNMILKSLIKYYGPKVLAICIIFLLIELLMFSLIAMFARKWDRNIIAWCIFGTLATPIIALLVLIIVGKRKENEPHFLS